MGETWSRLMFQSAQNLMKQLEEKGRANFKLSTHKIRIECKKFVLLLQICPSFKSMPPDGFVLHLLHTSFEVHFLTHKGIYLPLKKRNQITERIKFLSECSYILQFGITFKDIWHFWILLYVSHFSDDKDSDGKEKKSKSKEKDKDKKKEPASMFQINGEKDSKSKKKGDW